VPPGSTSLDSISQTLATMNPTQLVEVLAQMKAFVITHPDQARSLLVAHPQFSYALFQALLLNKIVDQAVLQRMLQATAGSSGPSGPPQPLSQPQMPAYQQPPPLHQTQPAMQMSVPPPTGPSMYQHQQAPPHAPAQHAYYRPPPPPPPPTAPQSHVSPNSMPDLSIDPTQRQMLMQVLSLTQEQINGLPPTERDAIQALRNQFMSGITT
jgi:cleavage stimulation factor subunit 2